MPGKAELRAEWNNAGKDVVVLHMMERGFTRPSVSPFVLKFETFLKVRLFLVNSFVRVQQLTPCPGKL